MFFQPKRWGILPRIIDLHLDLLLTKILFRSFNQSTRMLHFWIIMPLFLFLFLSKVLLETFKFTFSDFPCNHIKTTVNCREVFAYNHFFDFSQNGALFAVRAIFSTKCIFVFILEIKDNSSIFLNMIWFKMLLKLF